jgi:hypothetical protein
VINRSSFKNRRIKTHGAKKKFSKLNRNSFKVLNNYKNIIKISNLYKIKKKKIRRRQIYKKYMNSVVFSKKMVFVKLNAINKNTKIKFINHFKTFLVLNYLKLKKF